ncbi:3-oxoacyl-[acyl-carrier-protein] reductase FabG-like [Aphomia sociella]
MSFANKVVIVTGASSGIGAATAVLFAKEGASVVLVGRNDSKLSNVAEQCAGNGNTPLVVKAEMSNDNDVKNIINETIDKFGKLDILVNNAGMTVLGGIFNGDILKAYDETMAINTHAVILLTTLAAPHLVQTKGNIINVSSVTGKNFFPGMGNNAYEVSKAALDHFTRGAALELASAGIRVNTVSPGPVITDFLDNCGMSSFSWDAMKSMPPLKRCSEPEEIAEIIIFLASENAKGILIKKNYNYPHKRPINIF